VSVVTKTGDNGTTGLMYNRRVPKDHPRVEAYGAVDETNAAIGLARASSASDFLRDRLLAIQKDLVILMGELATLPQDLQRYRADGFPTVSSALVAKLDAWVAEIEAQKVSLKGWATPGETAEAATLDLARSVCRRAERRVCALMPAGELPNPEILTYLNRLSDLLWLMARWSESQKPKTA